MNPEISNLDIYRQVIKEILILCGLKEYHILNHYQDFDRSEKYV